MGWGLKKDWSLSDIESLTLRKEEDHHLYKESSEGLLVPRGYEGFNHKDPLETLGEELSQFTPISLRDEQKPAVDAVMAHLRDRGTGAVLYAPCGKGKTVMGLEILRRLNRTTLVLVHKSFLVDQWVERIKTFLPEAKVGLWQRDIIPTGDEDIVIGMVQSLVNPKREYDPSIYRMFGTLICDETHRYGAPMWQDAISKMPAKFRIGLTATPERKDGLQEIIFLHIGPIVYEMEGHTRVPSIWRIDTDTHFEPRSYKLWNGEVNTSKLVTMVSKVPERTDLIVTYCLRALKTGRKILILSERVAHVKEMVSLLKELVTEDFTIDKYIGGMTSKAREISSEADVIIGTYAMAQEGLDIPELDTLILATPKTSITQSVGRILRDSPNKKSPIVVDIVDSRIEILTAYWWARRKVYEKHFYKYV